MTYKEQLEKVKYLRDSYIKTMTRMDNTYSSIMDDTAKRYNQERLKIRVRDYDRQIERLEALADKEREQAIYDEAIKSITIDTSQVSEAIDKCLSEAFILLQRGK